MLLPLDHKAYIFCNRWSPDRHRCMQRNFFERTVVWTVYVTKLWKKSSASHSINAYLHLKPRSPGKFIATRQSVEIRDCLKNPNVRLVCHAIGNFPIKFANDACRAFEAVICRETFLLCLPIRWQVCRFL